MKTEYYLNTTARCKSCTLNFPDDLKTPDNCPDCNSSDIEFLYERISTGSLILESVRENGWIFIDLACKGLVLFIYTYILARLILLLV